MEVFVYKPLGGDTVILALWEEAINQSHCSIWCNVAKDYPGEIEICISRLYLSLYHKPTLCHAIKHNDKYNKNIYHSQASRLWQYNYLLNLLHRKKSVWSVGQCFAALQSCDIALQYITGQTLHVSCCCWQLHCKYMMVCKGELRHTFRDDTFVMCEHNSQNVLFIVHSFIWIWLNCGKLLW